MFGVCAQLRNAMLLIIKPGVLSGSVGCTTKPFILHDYFDIIVAPLLRAMLLFACCISIIPSDTQRIGQPYDCDNCVIYMWPFVNNIAFVYLVWIFPIGPMWYRHSSRRFTILTLQPDCLIPEKKHCINTNYHRFSSSVCMNMTWET